MANATGIRQVNMKGSRKVNKGRSAPVNWRKATRYTSYCFIIVLVVSVMTLIDNPNVFPINSVKVRGEFSHTGEQNLQQAISPYVDGSFFQVSLKEVQHSVEQLDWVQSARVARSWPDTIIVQVAEKHPVAQWNNSQLVTENGQTFLARAKTWPADLPKLSGPPEEKLDVFNHYRKISQQLAPMGLQVASLSEDSRHTWQMALTNGITVHLGDHDIDKRMTRFAKSYPKLIAGRENSVAVVDMRYNHGIAIKWKQQASA